MKTASGGRWLVVYMPASQHQAGKIARMLEDEGFLVKIKSLPGSGAFEIRVLASEAEEARSLLMEKGL
ncbi:MAG: hypothetical protein IJ466_08125 [Clostridia bacterium]|nr:hypothetical protein [Clostridia bacterium]